MIFDIITTLIILILPLYLIYIVFKLIFLFPKHIDLITHFKVLFCLLLTFGVVMSTMMLTTINIYQVATIFFEMDIEQFVLETIYIFIIFLWQMIAITVLITIWKFPYFRIIPGEGDLKTRIKTNWTNFKGEFKYDRRKKSIGNNNS